MTWQDEVTPEQWAEWQDLARKSSKAKKMHTTLGPLDYAASAIERLLEQKERPSNVEAWIRKTINNQYIDRYRKIESRGGISHREWSDERWEEESKDKVTRICRFDWAAQDVGEFPKPGIKVLLGGLAHADR